MKSSFRSPTFRIGVALICLMVLTQASCTTLQLSPSFAPGSGETDPGEPADSDMGKSSTGRTVGIATLVAVGGYLLYRVFIEDSEERTNGPKPDSSSTNGWVGESQVWPVTRLNWDRESRPAPMPPLWWGDFSRGGL